MLEVIYMKAEYEPWWMFDGWEEEIISRHQFKELAEAKLYLNDLLTKLRSTNEYECIRKNCFYAFWSDSEKTFCEACDDDLQIYHGVFIFNKGEPLVVDS